MTPLSGIAAGDIGFTRGSHSLVTWLIRHITGASYSHAFVFVAIAGQHASGAELWTTHEAWPTWNRTTDGPRIRTRIIDTTAPRVERRNLKIVRPARTPAEGAAIAAVSASVVADARPYGWGTIAAIVARGAHLPVRAHGRGLICSEHVYIAVAAVRPELTAYLADVLGVLDPGQLSEAVDALLADDRGAPGSKSA